MAATAKNNNQDNQPMSQKEAVYSAVQEVLGADSFEGQDLNRIVTSEQRKEMVDRLMEGFKSGVITLQTKFPSDQALRTYCTGLLSNWLRKDTRLNGGAPYQPKHPGIRGRGVSVESSDPQLKAMVTLLAQVTEPARRREIQKYIDDRKAELAESTPIYKGVDFDALPEGLRAKFA
jgi:hypothetical protein